MSMPGLSRLWPLTTRLVRHPSAATSASYVAVLMCRASPTVLVMATCAPTARGKKAVARRHAKNSREARDVIGLSSKKWMAALSSQRENPSIRAGRHLASGFCWADQGLLPPLKRTPSAEFPEADASRAVAFVGFASANAGFTVTESYSLFPQFPEPRSLKRTLHRAFFM